MILVQLCITYQPATSGFQNCLSTHNKYFA